MSNTHAVVPLLPFVLCVQTSGLHMAPIAPAQLAQSPFFAAPDTSCTMQNSLVNGTMTASSAAASSTGAPAVVAAASASDAAAVVTTTEETPAAKTQDTLEALSMSLPTRSVNDYVEDTAKLEKMAAAVKVLLEVRHTSYYRVSMCHWSCSCDVLLRSVHSHIHPCACALWSCVCSALAKTRSAKGS